MIIFCISILFSYLCVLTHTSKNAGIKYNNKNRMTYSFDNTKIVKAVASVSDIMSGGVKENLLHSELFKILGIIIPKPIRSEEMATKDVADQISSYLRDEMEKLCESSSLLNKLAIYEDIEDEKNCIINKRDNIEQQINLCLKLHEEATGNATSLSEMKCPLEGFYAIKGYGIWVENLYALSIDVDEATTIDVLIASVLCKLSRLYSFCNTIINQRDKISEDIQASLKNYNEFQKETSNFLILAVNKALEDRPKKNGAQQKKYIQKVIKRINDSPLCLLYHDEEQFAKYIAQTPGISKFTVWDFLIDVKIVENLNPWELTKPFLKEEYLNYEHLEQMLEQAYMACTAPRFLYSTSTAYSIIWYWMVDEIKIAIKGKPHGIERFTMLMNKITKSDVSPESMPTLISRNKKEDYSDIMVILGNLGMLFKLKDVKS